MKARLMTIDFHTHAFDESIAPQALQKLAETGGALVPHTDGTIAGLERMLSAEPEARAVVLPIATKHSQMHRINDWAAASRTERIEVFGSIHPTAPDALEELERIDELGLKGIKLHPEYQQFHVDDDSLRKVYRKTAKLGLITVFHAGWDIGFPPPVHCTPAQLKRALPAFDGAPVVAAHFGGYMMWEEVLDKLCGLPLYFDTAYSHSRVIIPLAQRIIERHGADRILFGSDSPWSDFALERALIDSLALTEAERELIFYKNAERLLGWA